jgi:integrase
MRTLGELDGIVRGFEQAQMTAVLCERAAAVFRQLTGFDRVMIYQFAADEAGRVVAEDCDPALGGFRRSELTGFDLRDAALSADGLVLFVTGSKNDQERWDAEVAIRTVPGAPLCAVTALRAWLQARGDTPGALFSRVDRGGHLTQGLDGRLPPIDTKTVARLVKRVVGQSGLDMDEFSAHSLRAGMMAAADRKGVPLERAMQHGRWKGAATARGYRRHSSLWAGELHRGPASRRAGQGTLVASDLGCPKDGNAASR